jgi:hypothetical protein
LGWWHDVSAGETLLMRDATASDLARCKLRAGSSLDPNDYLCENFESGSLVLKLAIARLKEIPLPPGPPPPAIYVDSRGELVASVSAEQVEAVLGPHVDRIRADLRQQQLASPLAVAAGDPADAVKITFDVSVVLQIPANVLSAALLEADSDLATPGTPITDYLMEELSFGNFGELTIGNALPGVSVDTYTTNQVELEGTTNATIADLGSDDPLRVRIRQQQEDPSTQAPAPAFSPPLAHADTRALVALLDEVRRHFTRDDDLPDDLLPRIDKAIEAVMPQPPANGPSRSRGETARG